MQCVWKKTRESYKRFLKFFHLNLSHESLFNFYKMNFALQKFHGWSFEAIDNMLPFEREVYISLLEQHLESKNNEK